MANNLAVTDISCQHKPVYLQTCYNPRTLNRFHVTFVEQDMINVVLGAVSCIGVVTVSTKPQIDHVLFKRRDMKAVYDTRVFKGADIQSIHRLMICKPCLKFRKPGLFTTVTMPVAVRDRAKGCVSLGLTAQHFSCLLY